MQFDDSFSVQAPIDDVYAAISDVERVVPCVPDAELLERKGDDVFEVAVKAHLGPLFKHLLGTITVVERDPEGHRLVMTNNAREADGDPVGEATIEITLAELGANTNVSIHTDATIADGMFGEHMITEAAGSQMEQFAENLQALVAGAAAS
ncbi:MAG: uncharacterized protein QOE11_3265 [Solirubrobacteraceae bacterium]|nr:uncharacterized protein [Solirubrobacteraceae bacterium]